MRHDPRNDRAIARFNAAFADLPVGFLRTRLAVTHDVLMRNPGAYIDFNGKIGTARLYTAAHVWRLAVREDDVFALEDVGLIENADSLGIYTLTE